MKTIFSIEHIDTHKQIAIMKIKQQNDIQIIIVSCMLTDANEKRNVKSFMYYTLINISYFYLF